MASQRSKRKRRARTAKPPAASPSRGAARGGSALRDRAGDTGNRRTTESRSVQRRRQTASGTLGTVGERPQGFFGGVPVSELAILAGGIAFVIGLVRGGGPALYVGLIVLAVGVVEFTAREHFSGYRSHTTLLAAIPTLAIATALELTVGAPSNRLVLVVVVVPVFAALFFLLRRQFTAARQARIARPPTP